MNRSTLMGWVKRASRQVGYGDEYRDKSLVSLTSARDSHAELSKGQVEDDVLSTSSPLLQHPESLQLDPEPLRAPDYQLNTVNIFDLEHQTNIYSLTVLQPQGLHYPVVFVATCAKVYCMFQRSGNVDGPAVLRVLPLNNIPRKYRIVSIDAFTHEYNVVLGVTFIPESQGDADLSQADRHKKASQKAVYDPGRLHIYVFNAKYLGDQLHNWQPLRWQAFPLNYIPLKLIHCSLDKDGKAEDVFLLTGTDRKIHVFYHLMEYDFVDMVGDNEYEGRHMEGSGLSSIIPDQTLFSSMLCVDIKKAASGNITAMGGQDGLLTISIAHTVPRDSASIATAQPWPPFVGASEDCGQSPKPEVHSMWLNGPIASVQLFTFKVDGGGCAPLVTELLHRAGQFAGGSAEAAESEAGESQNKSFTSRDAESTAQGVEHVNLLVAEAMGRVFIFLDVMQHGLNNIKMLPDKWASPSAEVRPLPKRKPSYASSSPDQLPEYTLDGFRLPSHAASSDVSAPLSGDGLAKPGRAFNPKFRGRLRSRLSFTSDSGPSAAVNPHTGAHMPKAASTNSMEEFSELEAAHEQRGDRLILSPSNTDATTPEPTDGVSGNSPRQRDKGRGMWQWRSLAPSENSVLQHGVTCARACDISGRGVNHILVCTWDNKLLYYSPLDPEDFCMAQQSQPYVDPDTCCLFEVDKLWGGYQLTNCVDYAHPIYAIQETDLDCDGIKETIMCGQFECYILKSKPPKVKEHLDKVLVLLDELLLMERELQYFKSYGAD